MDMKIQVSGGSIQENSADTLIVNLFENVSEPGGATGAVDRALDGAITEMIAQGDLSGKAGEIGVLYPRAAIPAKRVLVVGLGKVEDFDLEGVRKAAGGAIKRARDLNASRVATILHGAGTAGLPVQTAAQAVVEGTLLALYHYAAPRQEEQKKGEIEALTIVEFDESKLAEIRAGVEAAEAIFDGVSLARDLVNMPPNVATPTRLAQAAEQIAADSKMRLTVGDREWAAERNMGGFLAVAKGAGEPPKFIVLEYNLEREDLDTVVIVGKGITFDTGGISLKPGENMGNMKSDMGGAAAVLGTMRVIGRLGLPLRVIGIAPCTENMPDANAYRPADVITASNGKTIEIVSTDAEGRMVLADGLVYAQRYNPKLVIDLATLTGACVIALGQGMAAGMFSTDEKWSQKLAASGKATHERVWPMPLWDDYKKSIESEVADIKNSGGRFGGVATSAIFLKQFTDYPWVHLDIAGMALATKEDAYIPSGATGFGVRLLADFLRNWQR
jgi:leucyl aminopeptidase